MLLLFQFIWNISNIFGIVPTYLEYFQYCFCSNIFLKWSKLKKKKRSKEAAILALKNIDLNARTSNGSTAFMVAGKKGQGHVVQLLLRLSNDKNIDLNTRGNY